MTRRPLDVLTIKALLFGVLVLALIIAGLSCSTAAPNGATGSAGAVDTASQDGAARLPAGITPDKVYDNRLLVRFKDGVKTASAVEEFAEKYTDRGVSFVKTVDLAPF